MSNHEQDYIFKENERTPEKKKEKSGASSLVLFAKYSFVVFALWLAITSMIYRLHHADQTETELFFHMWDAACLRFK